MASWHFIDIGNTTSGTALFTHPGGFRHFFIESVSGLFTADANVANRSISLRIVDASGDVYVVSNGSGTITASSTVNLYATPNIRDLNSNNPITIRVPNMIPIPPGGSVYLEVQNNQAGDAFSLIKIVIREEN